MANVPDSVRLVFARQAPNPFNWYTQDDFAGCLITWEPPDEDIVGYTCFRTGEALDEDCAYDLLEGYLEDCADRLDIDRPVSALIDDQIHERNRYLILAKTGDGDFIAVNRAKAEKYSAGTPLDDLQPVVFWSNPMGLPMRGQPRRLDYSSIRPDAAFSGFSWNYPAEMPEVAGYDLVVSRQPISPHTGDEHDIEEFKRVLRGELGALYQIDAFVDAVLDHGTAPNQYWYFALLARDAHGGRMQIPLRHHDSPFISGRPYFSIGPSEGWGLGREVMERGFADWQERTRGAEEPEAREDASSGSLDAMSESTPADPHEAASGFALDASEGAGMAPEVRVDQPDVDEPVVEELPANPWDGAYPSVPPTTANFALDARYAGVWMRWSYEFSGTMVALRATSQLALDSLAGHTLEAGHTLIDVCRGTVPAPPGCDRLRFEAQVGARLMDIDCHDRCWYLVVVLDGDDVRPVEDLRVEPLYRLPDGEFDLYWHTGGQALRDRMLHVLELERCVRRDDEVQGIELGLPEIDEPVRLELFHFSYAVDWANDPDAVSALHRLQQGLPVPGAKVYPLDPDLSGVRDDTSPEGERQYFGAAAVDERGNRHPVPVFIAPGQGQDWPALSEVADADPPSVGEPSAPAPSLGEVAEAPYDALPPEEALEASSETPVPSGPFGADSSLPPPYEPPAYEPPAYEPPPEPIRPSIAPFEPPFAGGVQDSWAAPEPQDGPEADAAEPPVAADSAAPATAADDAAPPADDCAPLVDEEAQDYQPWRAHDATLPPAYTPSPERVASVEPALAEPRFSLNEPGELEEVSSVRFALEEAGAVSGVPYAAPREFDGEDIPGGVLATADALPAPEFAEDALMMGLHPVAIEGPDPVLGVPADATPSEPLSGVSSPVAITGQFDPIRRPTPAEAMRALSSRDVPTDGQASGDEEVLVLPRGDADVVGGHAALDDGFAPADDTGAEPIPVALADADIAPQQQIEWQPEEYVEAQPEEYVEAQPEEYVGAQLESFEPLAHDDGFGAHEQHDVPMLEGAGDDTGAEPMPVALADEDFGPQEHVEAQPEVRPESFESLARDDGFGAHEQHDVPMLEFAGDDTGAEPVPVALADGDFAPQQHVESVQLEPAIAPEPSELPADGVLADEMPIGVREVSVDDVVAVDEAFSVDGQFDDAELAVGEAFSVDGQTSQDAPPSPNEAGVEAAAEPAYEPWMRIHQTWHFLRLAWTAPSDAVTVRLLWTERPPPEVDLGELLAAPAAFGVRAFTVGPEHGVCDNLTVDAAYVLAASRAASGEWTPLPVLTAPPSTRLPLLWEDGAARLDRAVARRVAQARSALSADPPALEDARAALEQAQTIAPWNVRIAAFLRTHPAALP